MEGLGWADDLMGVAVGDELDSICEVVTDDLTSLDSDWAPENHAIFSKP